MPGTQGKQPQIASVVGDNTATHARESGPIQLRREQLRGGESLYGDADRDRGRPEIVPCQDGAIGGEKQFADGGTAARGEEKSMLVARRAVMTQATGSDTIQTVSALQSMGRQPEWAWQTQAQSYALQIPETLAAGVGASAERAGCSGVASGGANPDSGREVAAPGGGPRGDAPQGGAGAVQASAGGAGAVQANAGGAGAVQANAGGNEAAKSGAGGAGAERAGSGQARAVQAQEGCGEGGESLQGPTPSGQALQNPTPPTSGILISARRAFYESQSATASEHMGARPKTAAMFPKNPETENLLQAQRLLSEMMKDFPDRAVADRQGPAAGMPAPPSGGTVKLQQPQRVLHPTTGATAPPSGETPTLHHFFPITYKKQVFSPKQQFQQQQMEPLSTLDDHGAAPLQQQPSTIDDNVIHITASQGIPMRSPTTTTTGSSLQPHSILLSKDFMEQFFLRFKETALESNPDSPIPFPQALFLPTGSQVPFQPTTQTPSSFTFQLPDGSMFSFGGAARASRAAREVQVPIPQPGGTTHSDEGITSQEDVDNQQMQACSGTGKATSASISIPDDSQASDAQASSATDWTEIKKKALKEFNLTGARSLALPVTYDAQGQNPRWERLDHDVIKELVKAIRDNGLGSPYFKQLLKATFNIYDLTPFDLKSIASMILTDSQSLIWEAKWKRALEELRRRYRGGLHAGITVAEMAGDPPHDDPARQARDLPRDVLTDIKEAARKAIVQISPTGVPDSIYTEIKQGPSESFSSFIDRLTQAIDRQVNDDGAKPHLLQSLAFANASAECKHVISAMPGQPSLAEMLEACSKVGTPQHVASIHASIWGQQMEKIIKAQNENFKEALAALRQDDSAAAVVTKGGGQCYKCGKHGHFKRNCPEHVKTANSSGVCPRCRRGKHQASHCHAKTDVDGRPLPLSGNSKKSANRQRATTQVMAMTQSQIPQAAQLSGNVNPTASAGQSTGSPVIQTCCHPGHNVTWQLPK